MTSAGTGRQGSRGRRCGPRALAAALLVLGATEAAAVPLVREVHAMGTRLTLEVDGLPEAGLAAATEAAVRESERIEAACSTWRPDTAWSRLNAAGGAARPLDQEWLRLLGAVLALGRETGGAFDPVLGALISAWGTRQGGRTPTPAELEAARQASGAALLELDLEHGTARLRHPAAALEEGGFLKGYALDRMAEVLRRAGVRSALLDFGGQLLAFGAPRAVGLAGPEDRQVEALQLELRGASLSTSGTSEHGRHILEPATGQRSPAWGSVSVLAADGLTADVLSTALYVMGPQRGPAWAEAHRVAAVFQRPGLAPRFTGQLRAVPSLPAVPPRSPR